MDTDNSFKDCGAVRAGDTPCSHRREAGREKTSLTVDEKARAQGHLNKHETLPSLSAIWKPRLREVEKLAQAHSELGTGFSLPLFGASFPMHNTSSNC